MDKYEKIIIDLGTGDGRFVYKNALKNPQNLYIGIDPSEKQLDTYKRKINRKKLENILLFVGSLEVLPKDLIYQADEVYIILPWGSLLRNTVKPEKNVIKELSNLIKNKGSLTMVLGYSQRFEPKEVTRLEIPQISRDLITDEISPKIKKYGHLQLVRLQEITQKELKKIESTWSKKLSFGKDRPIYKLKFVKL